jgi:hypothetical protein
MSLSNEIAREQTLDQLREALKRSQQQYGKLKVRNDELVQAIYQAAKGCQPGHSTNQGHATQERHSQRQARGSNHSLHRLAARQANCVLRQRNVR